MILVLGVWAFVRALLVNSAAVSQENVVLRHQLALLQRSVGRPRLRRRDRIFWVESEDPHHRPQPNRLIESHRAPRVAFGLFAHSITWSGRDSSDGGSLGRGPSQVSLAFEPHVLIGGVDRQRDRLIV